MDNSVIIIIWVSKNEHSLSFPSLELVQESCWWGHSKNIKNFMPEIISIRYGGLLMNSLESHRTALIRQKGINLFPIDREDYLLNVSLSIRVDTHFSDCFLMSGPLTRSTQANRSLITDELGNILHFHRGLGQRTRADPTQIKEQEFVVQHLRIHTIIALNPLP